MHSVLVISESDKPRDAKEREYWEIFCGQMQGLQ